MLSCSTQTLVNNERKGLLHPQYAYRTDGRGAEHRVIVYNPHELKKLANRLSRHGISPRDPGEIAARAFELFDEDRPERVIVKELRITPDQVRELHEKWNDAGGADLVISIGAKESFEKLVGPFGNVAELIERVAGGAGLVILPGAKEALEKLIGPFGSVAELIDRVAQLKATTITDQEGPAAAGYSATRVLGATGACA